MEFIYNNQHSNVIQYKYFFFFFKQIIQDTNNSGEVKIHTSSINIIIMFGRVFNLLFRKEHLITETFITKKYKRGNFMFRFISQQAQ